MPINRLKRKFPAKTIFSFFLLLGLSLQAKADINAKLSDGDTLGLLGIGMYYELRNDIYIGALFGPQSVNDVEQLRGDKVAKRMSLRFVSEYSSRKLSRHWKERMALNNPREQWQPLTREIVGFSNLFKRTFVAGDEINIDFVPGVGVQVYLNQTLFKTFPKSEFMEVLLNVWLGNIPPTKAFMASIRGQDDASTKSGLIAGYSGLTPVKGRFDADLAPPVQVAAANNSKQTAVEEKPAEKPAATKVAKQEPVKDKPETKVETPAPSKTAKAAPETETDTTGGSSVAANTPTMPDIKLEPVIETPVKQTPAKKVAKVELPPVEEDLIDVDLIAGSYTRDLINAIRVHQEYPRQALLDRKEGDVTAKVTIATDGSLVEVEIIEQSGTRILDKAVQRIIRKTAPFQAIPPELGLKEFVFEVPISFKL